MWLESSIQPGDGVPEIGPGPSLTTDLLRQRVAAVTAFEFDADLAADLKLHLAHTNCLANCTEYCGPLQIVAVDSLDTDRIRQAHIDDTFVPLDPATLESANISELHS